MKRLFFTFIFSLLFCGAVFASAQGANPKGGVSLFDQWENQSVTNIELHVNFDSLEVFRKKDGEIDAQVVANGQVLDLDVSVRGRFRRRTCTIPPLKLQFKKDNLRAFGLNTHNDFKLVTHCTEGEEGQDAILREQLAYELYNTVNPTASFRTQLLTVTYVNTVDQSTVTSYAILIEDTDELRERMGMEMKNCDDCFALPAQQVTNAETVALFQYMIGNSDFSTSMVRNLKLMQAPGGSTVAVPYDFDFSGLVNASYASGFPNLGETRVTDRTLIWEYADADPDFYRAKQYFLDLEEELMGQVAGFEQMSGKSKREISKYLKTFFKELKADEITAK
ncbi:hypothetical protein [Lewinella sp. W8]|uniref:hypothetical protein n=1 Tax=Lewinella sp. W8 TaxID=2528208 RepID=UPI001067B754|nr:hypothetical protein [Lewinella sp. W8]MTB49340.1 hypothetical protein [Lewinella sp. W8]